MGGFKVSPDRFQVRRGDGKFGVGPVIAQSQNGSDFPFASALSLQGLARLDFNPGRQGPRLAKAKVVQCDLKPGLPQAADLGLTDAPG